jgi:hypothetical protein
MKLQSSGRAGPAAKETFVTVDFFLSLVVACGWTEQMRVVIIPLHYSCTISRNQNHGRVRPGCRSRISASYFWTSYKVGDHEVRGHILLQHPTRVGSVRLYASTWGLPLCRSQSSHSQGYVRPITSNPLYGPSVGSQPLLFDRGPAL